MRVKWTNKFSMLEGDSSVADKIWDISKFTSDLLVDEELAWLKIIWDSRLDVSRESLINFLQCSLSLESHWLSSFETEKSAGSLSISFLKKFTSLLTIEDVVVLISDRYI